MQVKKNNEIIKTKNKFYLVSTPIGNLEDISFRAIDTFRKVDFILCEDTRVTIRLLQKYEIKTVLKSYRQNQKESDLNWLKIKLLENKNIALACDAGTPGISDPSSDIVRMIRENDLAEIIAIPGASALATALTLSGWKTNPSLFTGFLSVKSGARKRYLSELKNFEGVIVIYESVYRVKKLIYEIKEILSERNILICRELTKLFEEKILIKSDDSEWKEKIENIKLKGEFTIVLSPLF